MCCALSSQGAAKSARRSFGYVREKSASLFRSVEAPGSEAIVEAVRAAGKQGDLAIAEVPVAVLNDLGLRLVATPGGTADAAVNAVHLEARLGRWLRIRLWIRRTSVAAYFNAQFAERIAAAARVIE